MLKMRVRVLQSVTAINVKVSTARISSNIVIEIGTFSYGTWYF